MKYTIRICGGQRCKMNFSEDVIKCAETFAERRDDITMECGCCMGMCSQGPNMKITNNETGETEVFHQLDDKKTQKILEGL